MNISTAEETSISWGPSTVDMTSIQRSIFYRLFSSQAIRTASVSDYTLCPRLDGQFDHVNERAIQFGTTVVALSNSIYKGLCPLPCLCRPRTRLFSSTTSLFTLNKNALGSCLRCMGIVHQLNKPYFFQMCCLLH